MKRFFKFICKTILWFIVITVLWVVAYKFVPVPYTPLMAIRAYNADEGYETKHDWVAIESISENLQLAVICSEDQNFMNHNGFDYEAIEKAYKKNKQGKKLRGASTISQQTAKNVFLWPNRSWLRKGMEVYFTFLIETLWSKERIVEVYLNSIEMGNGVYGAEAASQYWFKKSAKNLSQYEAAAIAAILPNPRNYKASPASAYIEKRKAWIVQQMRYYGTFTLQETSEK
ncbi:monofunctional biosynthetic peptidoglycan transglycosylase [Marixanthomonas sp. SCSIO 43207]|uniref:monofunctional biosynthetic peptidoglycan transglycosylase n=1 Tax=Marixanthomonas sp. SCSIO 43207 TaxID=2779360 RepID=UPI001CA845E7|nr:monofunctional biosynthetic peptidoglycan transglycosylase [Marixanthomonas sp. SCSIO 43207]UAB81980.1 monofunctional biosynthetic peptidoglycan transglycosylase [Marixanthomonas sp. SCSIO 43207]